MMAALWQRLRHGTALLVQQPDWSLFAGENWPGKIMDVPVADRFHAKQGRSIGRWRLQAGECRLTVYLKRHYRLPRWAGWLATLFPRHAWSPGLGEWQRLHVAARHGMPVPRAVAAGQWVGPWGRLRGFIAIEELADELPLHEAIPLAAKRLPSLAFAQWKRSLIVELVRLVRALHDQKLFHNDLYLCHFYIAEADTRLIPPDWRDRVHVIDFHRFGRSGLPGYARIKDLGQLLYSSDVDGLTDRDRWRFWRHYRGGPERHWLRWAILFKCGRYQRHNAKRRKRQ